MLFTIVSGVFSQKKLKGLYFHSAKSIFFLTKGFHKVFSKNIFFAVKFTHIYQKAGGHTLKSRRVYFKAVLESHI
jgi:hypothetical protein